MSTAGLNKIDFSKHIYEYSHPDPKDSSSICDWTIWAILHAKIHNEYWLGTSGGLNRVVQPYNDSDAVRNKSIPMREKFYQYKNNPHDSTSLTSRFIWSLYEDRRGEIWIGTRNGLSRYNRAKNNFINYHYKARKINGISHYKISCMYEDTKNRFWVGTEGGLNLMDREKGTFTYFFIKDGLPSDLIWGIMEDDKGYLWLSTQSGICRFDADNKKFTRFDAADGLPVNTSCYRFSYCKTKRGIMYIGTNNGLVYFNPDSIKDNKIPPDVLISDILIYNKLIKINENVNGEIILKQSIKQTPSITLSYKNKMLSIEFVALHFIDPDRNYYAYKMEGFDDGWNYVPASRRFANYTNLPAGKYTFKVKACNSDGQWNEKGESMVIVTVLPPWWETMWFKFLLILIIISASSGLFIGRIMQVERQKRKLKEQVDMQTMEIKNQSEILKEVNSQLIGQQNELQETNVLLEERQEEIISQKEEIEHHAEALMRANATKDKFFSIISHDLKNPIHAINGMAKMLSDSGKTMTMQELEESFQILSESSDGVAALLENLLTWARTQSGNITINYQTFDLRMVVDSTLKILMINAENKGLKLLSNIPENTMVFADLNMISLVIRNLVSNAIKFTNKGSITVQCIDSEDMLNISIIDTGLGMSEEIINKLFRINVHHTTKGTSGETGTGLGLIICKEFIENNYGRIWVESELGKGSSFIFTLKKA